MSIFCALDGQSVKVRGDRCVSVTSKTLQQLCERADRLYAAREKVQNVSKSLELLQAAPGAGEAFGITWRSARALFFLGQQRPDARSARADHTRGAEQARRAVHLCPERVEGYFWLGVNLSLLASRQRLPNALIRALQARHALRSAITIDPTYHAAGSLRVLGRLQTRLPRLLGGGRARAQNSYEAAIALAPDNTVTRIYFAALLVERHECDQARRQLETILTVPFDPDWAFEITRDRLLARQMLATLSSVSTAH